MMADSQFGSGATTYSPGTWYCGSLKTMPADDGSGAVEPVGLGYARVAKTNDATNFPAATTVSGETRKRNGTKITWPTPTGDWGRQVGYAWYTTATGGVPQFYNLYDAPRDVQSGITVYEIDVDQMSMLWQ